MGSWCLFQPDLQGDAARNSQPARPVCIAARAGHLTANQGKHVDSGSWGDGRPRL